MTAYVAVDPATYQRSVLVVEDEPLLRDLVRMALEARGFAVTTAGSVPEAVQVVDAADPDGIVMDVDLGPGPNGFDLAEALMEDRPGIAVLFLTNLPDARFAGRALDAVPRGVAYLRKTAVHNVGEIADALDAVMRGEVDAGMRHDHDPDRPLSALTRRQIEYLRLIALGYTNSQIATLRGVSLKATENTVARAFAALGIDHDSAGNLRIAAARRFIHDAGEPMAPADADDVGG